MKTKKPYLKIERNGHSELDILQFLLSDEGREELHKIKDLAIALGLRK